jgi:hypothetical protein
MRSVRIHTMVPKKNHEVNRRTASEIRVRKNRPSGSFGGEAGVVICQRVSLPY